YDTASRRLADDVQHVLLRLGIVSRVYERMRPYRERMVTGFTVTITGRGNLRWFHHHVGFHFLSLRKRRMVETLAASLGSVRASRDVVPVEVSTLGDHERRSGCLPGTDGGHGAGLAVRAACSPDVSKRGYRRWVIQRLADYFDSPDLARLSRSDVYWDRVTAIEPVGIRETYDLQIEGDHNFLANDFVVHNSHAASFALIAYAPAHVNAHHPAPFCGGLLNAYPMGFYHPATLVKDGQRHGVRFLPACVERSAWKCTMEDGAVRIGLRYVLGLRQEAAE